MKIILIPIILLSSVLVYHASVFALRQTSFESPRFLSLTIAAVTAVAMIHLEDAVITAVLLPYAALGLALLLLFMLRWLIISGVLERLRQLLGAVFKLTQRRSPPKLKIPDNSVPTGCHRNPRQTKE